MPTATHLPWACPLHLRYVEQLPYDAISTGRLNEEKNMARPEPKTSALAVNRIVMELELIVDFRLFGSGRWLADRETCCALEKKLFQMKVPWTSEDCHSQTIRAALNIQLYEVFFGVWDEGEVPQILLGNGLISTSLADQMYARMEVGGDPEAVLRGHVQRAYFDYHNVTNSMN
jgi:hypothetical protein